MSLKGEFGLGVYLLQVKTLGTIEICMCVGAIAQW